MMDSSNQQQEKYVEEDGHILDMTNDFARRSIKFQNMTQQYQTYGKDSG